MTKTHFVFLGYKNPEKQSEWIKCTDTERSGWSDLCLLEEDCVKEEEVESGTI